jgi:SAM-dependent MidA family methyltransferase
VFANEFYDAMPIHRFRYFPDKGWREDMVNAHNDQLYIEISHDETEAAHKFIRKEATIKNLPATTMEIAPMWYDITESLCSLLKLKKGAALIIDYGDEGYYGDSLRVA